MSLPTAIEKRDILYGAVKVSTEKLRALGQDFLKAGWLSDAADFFNQAQDREGLMKVRELAIEEGDTQLLLKTARFLGDAEALHMALERCALRAESLGKIRHAMRAWEKLEKADKVKELRARVSNDGDIRAEYEAAQVFIPEGENDLLPQSSDPEA